MSKEEYSQLRISEYSSLRNEVLENERIVLDRIMVILVAFIVAYYTVRNDPMAIYIVSLIFIAVIWINIYLTIKKVTNNARILGYIFLVHEPDSEFEWIGWEHSIEKYREKRGKYKESNKNKKLPTENRTDLFYTEFFKASIISVVIIFSLALISLPLSYSICINGCPIYATHFYVFIFIVSILFGFDAYKRKGSKEIYNSINYQKDIWRYTFNITK